MIGNHGKTLPKRRGGSDKVPTLGSRRYSRPLRLPRSSRLETKVGTFSIQQGLGVKARVTSLRHLRGLTVSWNGSYGETDDDGELQITARKRISAPRNPYDSIIMKSKV